MRSDQLPAKICPTPQTPGIEPGDQADAGDAGAVRGEEEGHKSPGEGVVEVVYEAGLGARPQGRLAERGFREDLSQPWRHLAAVVATALLEAHVAPGVADEEHREQKRGEADTGSAGHEHVAGRIVGSEPAG